MDLRRRKREMATMFAEAMETRPDIYEARYPHCDELVLHAPLSCEYCDHYPQRQQERIEQDINFTGEYDPAKKPCPAEERRSAATINRWGGNVAKPTDEVLERQVGDMKQNLTRMQERLHDA